MRIVGWQKISLIDYPGKISTILFTPGCQFRCFFCHNPELLEPKHWPAKIVLKEIFNYLKRREKVLDGVTITGGEPTLQKDLGDFLVQIKARGFLIKLDTNGLRPAVLERMIKQKLVDYLAMDIKVPLERYQEAVGVAVDSARIKRSIKIIKKSGLDYEFRSTLVPGFHGPEDVRLMAALIRGARNYYLQNFTVQAKIFDPKWQKTASFKESEMKEFQKIAGEYVVCCQRR